MVHLKFVNDEQITYIETYEPPRGQGYTRYASVDLYRTQNREFWTEGFHLWVTDDFGYLVHVGYQLKESQ